MHFLLTPPLAFLIYIPLVLAISGFGRLLAGRRQASAMKASTYGSGEAPPTYMVAPGYAPFLLIAFFFAIVHLAMLVLGTGGVRLPTVGYILGLMLALLALILG